MRTFDLNVTIDGSARDNYKLAVETAAETAIQYMKDEKPSAEELDQFIRGRLETNYYVCMTDGAIITAVVSRNNGKFAELDCDHMARNGLDWGAVAFAAMMADVYQELRDQGALSDDGTPVDFDDED